MIKLEDFLKQFRRFKYYEFFLMAHGVEEAKLY